MIALVADDSRVARGMVSRMVSSLGFEVITAEHGEDALEKVEGLDRLDAVVTDWNMPVMDGAELAKHLRRHERYYQVPILMISSETDNRRVAKPLLSGVDEYLFKPVDETMIRGRLEIMGLYTAESA